MNEKVWITWEIQQRNRSMSEIVDADLYELTSNLPRLFKYPVLSLKTIFLLYKSRNKTVFLQNPSIVLCTIGILFKNFFDIFLVVDEHNAGLYPLEGKSFFLNWMAKVIVRKSSLIIVTNENLKGICEKWGGNVYVMPDPIPKFGDRFEKFSSDQINKEQFRFLFVCSWAKDEPYQEVLSAAEYFSSEKIKLVVTGNFKNKVCPDEWPHVEFTGFISREKYLKELGICNAVIVLTTRNDCLNCGAYEAVSAGKPGILSDTSSLKQHFKKGFIFTDNSVDDIIAKTEVVVNEYEDLCSSLNTLKNELIRETEIDRDGLHQLIP